MAQMTNRKRITRLWQEPPYIYSAVSMRTAYWVVNWRLCPEIPDVIRCAVTNFCEIRATITDVIEKGKDYFHIKGVGHRYNVSRYKSISGEKPCVIWVFVKQSEFGKGVISAWTEEDEGILFEFLSERPAEMFIKTKDVE
jgi:hypothetical protein